MDKDNDILLAKLITGTLNEQEKDQIKKLADHDLQFAETIRAYEKIWKDTGKLCLFHKIECQKKQDFEKVLNCIKTKVNTHIQQHRIPNYTRWAVAASVTVLMGVAGIYLHQNVAGFGRWQAFKSENKIELITLPDASSVVLNKNSKIVYLKSTNESTRKVKLKGEAFFDVQKQQGKPFIINTDQADIKVIGTSFNVKTDKEKELTEVTVTEGIVSLESHNETIKLTKGEIGRCENGVLSKIDPIDENQLYWKTNTLNFNNNTIEEAAKILSNYFGEIKSVNIKANKTETRITTKFEDQPLNEIFEELQLHFNKKFTLEEGILVISD